MLINFQNISLRTSASPANKKAEENVLSYTGEFCVEVELLTVSMAHFSKSMSQIFFKNRSDYQSNFFRENETADFEMHPFRFELYFMSFGNTVCNS